MKLKDAMRRAMKICPKAAELSIFRSVRFLPKSDASPQARVFTSDNTCMVSITVSEDLPDALLPAAMLENAVKGKGDLEFRELDVSNIELAGDGAVYKVPKIVECDYFPLPPVTPVQFTAIDGWWLVPKVLHAAAKPKSDSKLAVVRFAPEFVECFDGVRLSRVEMDGPWSGLVPTGLFKNWPAGKVEVAFTSHHAFFRIGDELRIANLQNGAFPDTDKLVVPNTQAGTCLVNLEQLLEIVKRATEISPINLVMVFREPDCVRVKACDASGVVDTYDGTVPIAFGWGTPGQATVDGKFLQQTLKQCDTPNVKLSSWGEVDPLRIESGNLIECIWQRYWG